MVYLRIVKIHSVNGDDDQWVAELGDHEVVEYDLASAIDNVLSKDEQELRELERGNQCKH